MLKVEIILGIVASSQIVFLPAGQGNRLDPSTFLESAGTTP